MTIEREFITQCPYINVMCQALMKVTPIIYKNFRSSERKSSKRYWLTSIERQITQIIYSELMIDYEYDLLYEGGAEMIKNSYWILDPIDGSRNFMDSIPLFVINLALCKQGTIIAGITYDIIHDNIYWASKGHGAFVNRRKLSISNHSNILVMKNHIKIDKRIRDLGSSGLELAYVAHGQYASFYIEKPNLWDIASGIILIEEAGGYVEYNDDYLLCGEEEFCKSLSISNNNSHNRIE